MLQRMAGAQLGRLSSRMQFLHTSKACPYFYHPFQHHIWPENMEVTGDVIASHFWKPCIAFAVHGGVVRCQRPGDAVLYYLSTKTDAYADRCLSPAYAISGQQSARLLPEGLDLMLNVPPFPFTMTLSGNVNLPLLGRGMGSDKKQIYHLTESQSYSSSKYFVDRLHELVLLFRLCAAVSHPRKGKIHLHKLPQCCSPKFD